ALCFTTSFFAALTTRVEDWLLLVLLPLLAWLRRSELRRPAAGQGCLVALAVVLAAAYLPGILDAPIRYDPWWKTRLSLLPLIATNFGFWVGGDAAQRKLVLLIAGVGLLAALSTTPRVAAFWAAFWLLFSTVFALYGLNVGYTMEVHQPP